MKTKIILICLMALNCGLFAQIVPLSGLIGRWEFNGNANDGSPSGNHGIVYGAALTNDRCGNANSAYSFNGTSDYIQMAQPGPLGSAARSLSFWFRSTNSTINSPCAAFDYGTSNGVGDSWQIVYNYCAAGIGLDVSNQAFISKNSCLDDGTWHHIVAVYDTCSNSTNCAYSKTIFYIDGVVTSIGCNVSGLTQVVNTLAGYPVTIGRDKLFSARYFQGDLDDFYFYDRALTPQEVQGLFNTQCMITGEPNPCPKYAYVYSTNALPGATSYAWTLPNGWTGTSTTNNISVVAGPSSGIIKVVITTPCSIITRALNVTLSTRCCSQPTIGLTPLTGPTLNGTYVGTSYYLDHDITVTGSSALFQDAEVRILQGVHIIVPASMALYLEHAHLYACGANMWQGIVIQDKGLILAANPGSGSNLIEDADIAIDASNITNAHAAIPVQLFDVVFNNNRIGVQLSSTPAAGVTTLPIQVVGCVFTCRKMPFSSTPPFNSGSWASASTGSGGLRSLIQINATQGPLSPYYPLNLPFSNLKFPYNNQPGDAGIRITNIGDQSGQLSSGVTINPSVNYIGTNDFNLFDALRCGIDIQDASLTANNNVFQEMQGYLSGSAWLGGTGINHRVTGLMNASLDLRPDVNFTSGNRFWNCWVGISTSNVYDVRFESGLIRSIRNISYAPFGKGFNGMILSSNRFRYTIRNCEFNAIDKSILIDNQSGPYNMTTGNYTGTYADSIIINGNYFGAAVTSAAPTMPGTPEYSSDPITLLGGNASNWTMAGACTMFSNKMDRTYRGIHVDKMSDYPIEIGGSHMYLIDDAYNVNSPQSGIYASNGQGNLTINQNTVAASGPSNTRIKLIRCENNVSNGGGYSPILTLNEVRKAYIGFAFEGSQPSTKWECNNLYTPMGYGLSLENNGVIGMQGNPCHESGNEYRTTTSWVNTPYTLCNSSLPSSSPIYISTFFNVPTPPPPTHAGTTPYTQSVNFEISFPGCPPASTGNDCLYSTAYPTLPSQRAMASDLTGISENKNVVDGWNVFPNPTNGKITVTCNKESETLSVKIMDLAGKIVYTNNTNGNSLSIDISALKASIYLIEIQGSDNKIVHKKLIKTLE